MGFRDRIQQLLADKLGIHMMRGHVDAFLIVSPNIDVNLLADAIPRDTPAVFLHSPSPRPEQFSVGIDNRQGAYEAVRHLLDHTPDVTLPEEPFVLPPLAGELQRDQFHGPVRPIPNRY